MTVPPRVCPECGADRWLMRDAKRTHEALQRAIRQRDELARDAGLLSFKLQIAEAEARERHSSQARKISRQARVIKRLEAKLREARVRPYEDAPLDETSTGAEYDG